MITLKITNTNNPGSFSVESLDSHVDLKDFGYKNVESINQSLRFYSHLWMEHDGSQNVTGYKFANRMKDISKF